jgi:hypothetical protein
MHSGVRSNHKISQKKLKGTPRNVGSTRSQSDTEKQMAIKGIRPSKIAPNDGLCKRPPDQFRYEKRCLGSNHSAAKKKVTKPGFWSGEWRESTSQRVVVKLDLVTEKIGWGGRIRTFTVLINSEVSYQLDHAPAA